jgi:hypothetical protein
MLNMNQTTLAKLASPSLFVLVAAALVGCAHAQTVTLTSASAAAPPAPVAPVAAAPVAEADDAEEEDAEEAAPAPKAEAKTASKDSAEPMSFEALSAALGDGNKISLDVNQTAAPASKGLSADGYAAVGATHQAVDTASTSHAGDMKVGGGLSAVAVRAGVRESSARLRACYQHGLTANPRLAGRVMVSFSVDAQGAVSDVDTQSDAIPADVMSCVRDAFSAMTFAAPKSAPAKIVYPVDFNKDS